MPTKQEVFEFGRLQSNQDILVALVAGLILTTFVIWLYRRDVVRQPIWVAASLITFRLLALAVVAFVLLDPRMRSETSVVRRPRVALLFDRSQSMGTADDTSKPTQTRWSSMLDTWVGSQLINRIGAHRDVDLYQFGSAVEHLSKTDDLSKTLPDAGETRLGDAIIEATKGETPAALVVITDGINNAGAALDDARLAAMRAKTPVFAIPVGSTEPPSNVQIAEMQVPGRVFQGKDAVNGSAVIRATGKSPEQIAVEVAVRRAGSPEKVLSRLNVPISPGKRTATVPISFAPTELGRWEVVVRTPKLANEQRDDDNSSTANIEVIDRKTKVLLIAGAPDREYQFARAVLFRDKSVELSVLLQPGDEGTSQEAHEVLKAIPSDRAKLFEFDAIIAIDPDWTSIDPTVQNLIVEWVSRQAGGMIYIAGPVNTPHIVSGSPIASLLPVVPSPSFMDGNDSVAGDVWPVEFAAEGLAHRAFALDDNAERSKLLWKEFAGVFETLPVSRVKPGATVLATIGDPRLRIPGSSDSAPLFVSQFFGGGRVMYVGTGETWRLRRLGDKLHERLWIQMLRGVSEGRIIRGAGRGGILLDQTEFPPGVPIPIRVYALDEQFAPLRVESLKLSATTSQGPVEVDLNPLAGQPGRYEGLLPPPPPGKVRLGLILPGSVEIEQSILVRASTSELDQLVPDMKSLVKLATDTGGKIVSLDQSATLDEIIPKVPEVTIITGPPRYLWDNQWIAIIFASLLSLEWVLRKLHKMS